MLMNKHKMYVILFSALIAVFVLANSCSNPTVYNSSYYDQIKLFLSDPGEGSELFTTDLYTDKPFERDGSSNKYYYAFDSVISRTDITIDSGTHEVPPYSGVHTAWAEIKNAYFGQIMRIDIGGETTHAYDYQSIVTRKAFFIKIFNDGYQYHGWRFWGFNSPGNNFGAARTLNDGHYQTSLDGQGMNREYLLYDTLGIYDIGDSLTYASNDDDVIFVRIDSSTIRGLRTKSSAGRYKTGWRIGNTADPFNRLIFIETPVDYDVDTTSEDPLIVDTTKIYSYGYVAFYKAK